MPSKDIEKRREACRRYYKNNLQKERLRNIIKRKKMKLEHPETFIFMDIKRRCNSIHRKDYKYYGGRGIECLITVEEIRKLMERDNYWNFKKPSIDRIDNDGNYSYENCRFIEFGKNIGKRNRENSKNINKVK